ncbi:short-chain dehydrogenase/reductase SDR [Verminephrobacter eiseniae EF01-2]|uniref:Short-chain dehydrogenase/reductase SDR n=1 Tax=Verminephrobacter eiseniae (strain EF01-2) TaxID=391735 RepID=A1WNR7_VEREI|nr:SDR family NAD(P)-dependent oxidoreductase [Verminephrobacter eiseniae]ABM59274.1 short-chain dehydrogenase/reductase SDR [Verminephrobacter eiseniae EF01-2]
MQIDFKNETVAVSGAAVGFGRSIALRFAALGASVYACDIHDEAMAGLRAHGVVTDRVDLCHREEARDWIKTVEAHAAGVLSVLVNNAGGVAGQTNKPIETVADPDWDRVIAINLGATFALSQAAAAGMKNARAGAIVNISSGAGLRASLTGVQAYCAAKHGILGLTRQLAHELGPFGVRVNAVAPGFARTNDASEAQWVAMGAEGQAALLNRIHLRRLVCADDIADATVFLASRYSSMITGQILSVDGGY